MNQILIYILIGCGIGLVLVPLGIWIYTFIRNTMQRRMIKRLMRLGQILTPIDPRDFDAAAWQNKDYGNIEINPDDLKNLNKKLFSRSKESVDENFYEKMRDYIKEAEKIGHTNEKIKEEFRKKGYNEELIDKIFEENEQ